MTLAERIEAWVAAMAEALAAYTVAQSDDAHAQFALDEAQNRAEARIRSTMAKKLTEANIVQMVALDPDVLTCGYAALDARVTLKSTENAVEAQKAQGRALSWHVQLTTRTPEMLMVA